MTDPNLLLTLDALRRHYRAPRESSATKVCTSLSNDMQRWLKRSPFFILASATNDGLDCSPRGDMPGSAFRILDQSTIAIPDRRGNNRIDTLRNIIEDPRVGLVFLIPGVDEAVRIKGQARISIDPELLDMFALDGEKPTTVLLVTVRAAYVQNARAVRSSKLWDDDFTVDPELIPNASQLSTNR